MQVDLELPQPHKVYRCPLKTTHIITKVTLSVNNELFFLVFISVHIFFNKTGFQRLLAYVAKLAKQVLREVSKMRILSK